jgi:ABC-2 type transport system permease protein
LTSFLLVFGLTLRQLVSRRRSIVLVLLTLAPAGLGVIARYFGAPYPDTPFLGVVPNVFTGFLVQILCLFYGSSVVRDAIEDRTAVFILTTPTSRIAYVLGVYAALVVNVLVLLELGIIAAFLVWGAGLPGPFPGGVLFGPECRSLMGVVFLGALVYAALFMLIGMYTKHCAVIGVVYYMIFEVFLAFVPGPARTLAISAHLDALLNARFETRRLLSADIFDDPAPYEISSRVALIMLCVWFVLFMTTLITRARKHDFIELGDVSR